MANKKQKKRNYTVFTSLCLVLALVMSTLIPFMQMSVFAVNEAKWTANGSIINNSAGYFGQEAPKIVPSGANFIIAWKDQQDATTANYYGIRAKMVDANGQAITTGSWTEAGVTVVENVDLNSFKMISDGANGAIFIISKGSYEELYAKHITSAGVVEWDGTFPADPGVDLDLQDPVTTWNSDAYDVVTDTSGGAIIVADCGSFDDLKATRISSTGTKPWGSFSKTLSSAARVQYPTAIPDGSGGAVVTWQDERGGAWGNQDVYAIRIDSNGDRTAGWNANGNVVSNESGAQYYPKIADAGGGASIIFWTEENSFPTPDKIKAQKMDASGVKQWNSGNPIEIDTSAAVPSVAIADGSNGAIVAYDGSPSTNAQRVDTNGNLLWGAGGKTLTGDTDGMRAGYSLISDGSGGALFAMRDDDITSINIKAQKVASDGVVGSSKMICNETNNQTLPQIVSDGSNGGVIAWQDLRNYNYDVYAQRINSTGDSQWTANGLIINANNSTNLTSQAQPQIVSSDNGSSIVVWLDFRNGNWDLYTKKIDINGNAITSGSWDANGIPIESYPAGLHLDVYNNVHYKAVPDGTGGALIVWEDFHVNPEGGTPDLYGQRLDSTGVKKWGTNGKNIAYSYQLGGSEGGFPDIVNSGAGGAIITWVKVITTTNNYIIAASLDSDGNFTWGGSGGTAVCNEATKERFMPKIISDGSSGGIISWLDGRGSGGGYNSVYAQKINSSGTAQWTDDGVVLNPDNTATAHKLVSDGSGGAIDVQNKRTGPNGEWFSFWDICAQKVNPSGVTQWTIADTQANYSDTNSVPGGYDADQLFDAVSDNAGGVIIAYMAMASNGMEVYKINNAGSIVPAWGSTVESGQANQPEWPKISGNTLGGLIVSWASLRNGLDQKGIYAQYISPAGVAKWTANGLVISDLAENQMKPAVAADNDSGGIIVWQDNRNNATYSYDIYGQRVKPDTTPPSTPTVSSSTHPSQSTFYRSSSPSFSWSATDTESGVVGYSYAVNKTLSYYPDTTSEGGGTVKSYSGLSNGTWYFHIRAVDDFDNWGGTRHYRIYIDNYKPRTSAPRRATIRKNAYGYLYWRVTDSYTAGKSYVWIKIKKGSSLKKTISLRLTSINSTKRYRYRAALARGTYKFYIYARDRAGNNQYSARYNYLIVK